MREAAVAALLSLSFASLAASSEPIDLVFRGGRVLDPETGLDAVRDVGIRGDAIVRISAQPLSASRIIDVRGLVVAPGFIDLHQHQHDMQSYRLKALDGVTTALELETGVHDVARFLEVRRGSTLIHYGATAGHEPIRVLAWGLPLEPTTLGPAAAVSAVEGPATNEAAAPEQLRRILDLLDTQLDAGALGIGLGLEYTPGATRVEVIEVFRLAARRGLPIFVHIRSGGHVEPGSSVEALGEVIAAAAITGAPLHVVHINSMCGRDSAECLKMIEGARARGLDVTTEAYPYGVFMTYINSASFRPGWREMYGMDYGDLELPETGERLDRQGFEELHSSPVQRVVLGHQNPDDVVDAFVRHPLVMIASDGIKEHPRNAGTFSRVLERYVRTQRLLTLMDAVRKMSLMPAQRLEAATVAARRKGRLQEGADADIVVFDPTRIQDRASYRAPTEPSVGVRYLTVAGTLVVEEGRIVEGIAPGRPLTAGRHH